MTKCTPLWQSMLSIIIETQKLGERLGSRHRNWSRWRKMAQDDRGSGHADQRAGIKMRDLSHY